jgi:hypothetical protein
MGEGKLCRGGREEKQKGSAKAEAGSNKRIQRSAVGTFQMALYPALIYINAPADARR